jgi:hypothetical protein
MALSRAQLKNRGNTLSGLSSELIRDKNSNITFNGDADEIFVDANNGDFRLKGPFARRLAGLGAPNFQLSPGSPAIGAGVPVPEVKYDITGYPRDPVHPSIGAYEYRGSVTDAPPVVIQEVPQEHPSQPSQPSSQQQPPVYIPQPSPSQQPQPSGGGSTVGSFKIPMVVAGAIAAALILGSLDD